MNRILVVLVVLLTGGLILTARCAYGAVRRERELALRAQMEAMQARVPGGVPRDKLGGIDVEGLVESAEQLSGRVSAALQPSGRDEASAKRIEELLARIDALEKELAELRARTLPLTLDDSSPEALIRSIGVIGDGPSVGAELLAQRIAMRERFLQLFPSDPAAPKQLERLVGDYIWSDRPKALETLDRLGHRIALEPYAREDLWANAYIQNGRFDEGRAAYERAIRYATNEGHRADAMFFSAYSYMKEGRYDEAKNAFEALIASYRGLIPREAADSVDGARTQLEKIAEYSNQK